ncbi:hypothetical protein [Desulfoscipio sp. XC116]|uniref:hypothetical protein n=1 Tax=Desulfoscipio sp. XC116 TaxID=3144975 RepID=UPI00325C26F5
MVREKHFSNQIFLYGFIYFSTWCRNNNCSFCNGLQCKNFDAAFFEIAITVVNEILEKRNVDKAVIDDLLKRDMIVEFFYEGKSFTEKNLKNKQKTYTIS